MKKKHTGLKVDFSVHVQDLINFLNIKIGLCGVCIQYTHVFLQKMYCIRLNVIEDRSSKLQRLVFRKQPDLWSLRNVSAKYMH